MLKCLSSWTKKHRTALTECARTRISFLQLATYSQTCQWAEHAPNPDERHCINGVAVTAGESRHARDKEMMSCLNVSVGVSVVYVLWVLLPFGLWWMEWDGISACYIERHVHRPVRYNDTTTAGYALCFADIWNCTVSQMVVAFSTGVIHREFTQPLRKRAISKCNVNVSRTFMY